MGKKVAKPDIRVAEIAATQHGVVSIAQLHRAGLSTAAIRRRVAAGRLHRAHRGVYSVGHSALSEKGCCLAAVLAVGRGPYDDQGAVLGYWGAAISHLSAASLWELLPSKAGPCDVIVSGIGGRARRAGVWTHRSLSLKPGDVTLRHGIPVTTPARTIADLRNASTAGRLGAVPDRELRTAIRQANVIGLPLEHEDAADRTRSDLERDFLAICRHHRIPRPEVNVRIGALLVDFLWRAERLAVETDSYRYHRGKVAFQDDRGRDLELRRRGFDVLRLSERQIDEESERVAEVLAAALSQATARLPEINRER